MNSQSFDFKVLEDLSLKEQKTYLKRFFIPLKNGCHVLIDNDTYEIFSQTDIKNTYFNRMPKELTTFYFKEYNELRSIVYELNKPLMYENKINLCPRMKHEYKEFSTFSEKIQKRVNIILSYIKEILCSKNDESYKYILKWLANMMKGNKNNSCLYFRGEQGIGKSTLFQFIREHILGKLFLECDSEPIRSRFNDILGGKLLVAFEELPTFSTSDWMAVSSKLKRMITSTEITLEKKNKDPISSTNINNYVILSNNDAIQDDEGRRYFISDISNEQKGNHEYWQRLYKCFSDDIGHAFYSYLLEVDTDKFNPQDMPLTKNKLDSFVKRLDIAERFIKEEYILKKKEIKATVSELFDEFNFYCTKKNNQKEWGKIKFTKRLDELKIKFFKSNDKNKYHVSLDELNEIAKSRHWIHELDEFTEYNEYDSDDDPYGLDTGINKNNKNKELEEENNKLKSELEELKKQLNKVEVIKENNYASELKQAYEQITGERKEWVSKYTFYYDKWYATLSKQEQKKEDERRYNEGAHASEDRIGKIDWVNEYESLIKTDKKTTQSIKIKDEVNFIDEDSEEEEEKPAPIKKVIKEVFSESESESDSDEEPKPIKLPNKYKKYEIFKNTSYLVSASREYIQKVLKEDYYDYWEFGESMTNEYFFGIIHDKLKIPMNYLINEYNRIINESIVYKKDKDKKYYKKDIKELEELIIIQDDDSDTLELNDDENILSILDGAESEELEEKKAPKQTRNKKNFKEVVKKATKK